MTADQTPATAAGRVYLEGVRWGYTAPVARAEAAILAIEAEARALDRDALAAALAVVYGDGTGSPLTDHEYGAAAVLALLAREAPAASLEASDEH